MNWLKSTTNEKAVNRRFADAQEIRSVFSEHNAALYWTAMVITGEESLAMQSVVNAGALCETNNYVFREWLVRWAYIATARKAIQSVGESIGLAPQSYDTPSCSHSNHELLSDEEIAQLHLISPEEIVKALDPLARAVLVLHGCLHTSIADCSLLLRVPRKCVLSAYCAALQWHSQRSNANVTAVEPEILPFEDQPQSKQDPSFFRRKDSFNVVKSK